MCETWMMEHVVDGFGVADAGILEELPGPAEPDKIHLPDKITATFMMPLDLMRLIATLDVAMVELGALPAVMAEVASDANQPVAQLEHQPP